MYKKMNRHAFKAVLPWIVICLAAGALLLVLVTQFKAVTLLQGPAPLDGVSRENLDGSYVSFDQSRLVAVFATASHTGSDDSEVIDSYYYILRYGEEQYIALISNAKQYDQFASALAQSQSYYTENHQTLNQMGTVSGFVEPVDQDLIDTMAAQLESVAKEFSDTGLPGAQEGGDVASCILPYAVRLDRCGWLSYPVLWIATALWVLLFALAAVLIVLLATGFWQKDVRAYIQRTAGDLTLAQLEADFENAQIFDSIRLGDHYTWFYKGAKANAFQTQGIVWVYKAMYARASDKYRWGVIVALKDGTRREMYMPQDANRSKIIRAYQAKGLAFVSDYKSSYETLLNSDPEAFAQLAREEKENREQAARNKAMWEQV